MVTTVRITTVTARTTATTMSRAPVAPRIGGVFDGSDQQQHVLKHCRLGNVARRARDGRYSECAQCAEQRHSLAICRHQDRDVRWLEPPRLAIGFVSILHAGVSKQARDFRRDKARHFPFLVVGECRIQVHQDHWATNRVDKRRLESQSPSRGVDRSGNSCPERTRGPRRARWRSHGPHGRPCANCPRSCVATNERM